MSKKKQQKKSIRLHEGTAAKNLGKKEADNRTVIWVKNDRIAYEVELRKLQVELLKLQTDMRKSGERVLIIFEGRDAAGKGGTIKRFIEYLNPRFARVTALVIPNETEKTQWYFQRYTAHLPAAGELVLFDRSWYNRAMVEPVMGFCSDEQNKRFLKDAPLFERLLVKEGIKLFKFYFSISKEEQKKRFAARKTDPLKQYKISSVDEQAQDLWDHYTVRKFEMLTETNRSIAPWTIVRSDNKKRARLNCIKHLLSNMHYRGKIDDSELTTDPEIIVSGIDEISHMEKNLLNPEKLHG